MAKNKKKNKNKGRDKPQVNEIRFPHNTLVSVVLITETSDDDATYSVVKNVIEEQTHKNVDLIISSFRDQEECSDIMDKCSKLHLDIRWVFQEPNNNFIKDLTDLAEGEVVFYKTTNNCLWYPRHIEVHLDTYNKDSGYGFALSRLEERDIDKAESPFSILSWRIDNVPEINDIILDEISHVGHVDTDWSVCLKNDNGAPLFYPGLVLKQWISESRMRGGMPDEITIIYWKSANGESSEAEKSKEEFYKQVGTPERQEISEDVIETDDGIEIVRNVPTIVGNRWHDEYCKQMRTIIDQVVVDSIAIKRTMGMGDLILTEPIIKKLREKYPTAPIKLYTAKDDIVKYFKNKPDTIDIIEEQSVVKDILCDVDETYKIDLDLSYESREGSLFVDAYAEVADVNFDNEVDKHPQLVCDEEPLIKSKYVVVCGDGSGWPGKTWPIERYAEVIKHIKDKGYEVYETGAEATEETDSTYHKCPMDQMINLIANCEFYVGADNGPMHIARGFNKPCVAINGAASTYLSNPNRENIFYVENRTSKGFGCKHEQFFNLTEAGLTFVPYCEDDPSSGLDDISAEVVCEAVDKLLSTYNGLPYALNVCGSLVTRDVLPGFAYYKDETGSLWRENPSYHPDQRLNISQVYDPEKEKIWTNNFAPLVKSLEDSGVDKDAKILDVGCNMGILMAGLMDNDYTNVSGCDINRMSVIHGQETFKHISDNIFIKDFTSDTIEEEKVYDVIILSDVVNYVGDVGKLIRNAFKSLKDDGRLYVNSMVIDSEEISYNPRMHELIGHGEHTVLLTSDGLRKQLKENGFNNIEPYGKWKQEQKSEMVFWCCQGS